jgi:hypothetical protein
VTNKFIQESKPRLQSHIHATTFRLLDLIFGFAVEIDIAFANSDYRSVSDFLLQCSTSINFFSVLPISRPVFPGTQDSEIMKIFREMSRWTSRMETLELAV